MITGVQSLIYGVDALEPGERFYVDFGLPLADRTERRVLFQLEEGSTVELRLQDDPSLPPRFAPGNGPREVVWGVDSQASFDRLKEDLSRDRAVTLDGDGVLHTVDDAGIAIGLKVFTPKPVVYDAPPENTPSDIRRRNTHRKWFSAARPRQILHVVFGSDRAEAGVRFYVERLGFRITDIMRGQAMFLQCGGREEHHNLLLFKVPRVFFSHVSFAVENIDELAAGANHMQRRKWSTDMGIGRHRISSMLFYYLMNPAGGKSEYSADGDYLDENWKPRIWDEAFGHIHWLAQTDDDHPLVEGEGEIIEGQVPMTVGVKRTIEPTPGGKPH